MIISSVKKKDLNAQIQPNMILEKVVIKKLGNYIHGMVMNAKNAKIGQQ